MQALLTTATVYFNMITVIVCFFQLQCVRLSIIIKIDSLNSTINNNSYLLMFLQYNVKVLVDVKCLNATFYYSYAIA